jgi:valyl-tRNA synthetase
LREEGRTTLQHLTRIFKASLRLLSPFMPFITEEIWHALYQQKAPAKSIALTRFPIGTELSESQKSAITEMEIVQQLIVDIRNRRAELDVKPKERTPVRIFAPQPSTRALIESNRELFEGLADVQRIDFADASMSKLPGVQSKNAYEVAVVYEKKIDIAAEVVRLSRELKKLESESANNQRQLDNEAFLAKAPPRIVDGLRRRRSELEELLPKTRAALEELNNASSGSQ